MGRKFVKGLVIKSFKKRLGNKDKISFLNSGYNLCFQNTKFSSILAIFLRTYYKTSVQEPLD